MIANEAPGWTILWDRTEYVSAHTQKGIDFLEKYGQFVKERSLIEEEYALKLRNLVKKSIGKKKEEDEEKTFSYITSFYAMLHELDDLAGQHEVIAERLKKDIVPNVIAKCQQLRTVRKQQLADLQTMNSQIASLNENVNKFQKNYAKAFKEAESAYIKADKAVKNMELSRSEVEKAKHNARHKEQICEEAKQSYAYSLGIANQARQEHYQRRLPMLLESMRTLDVDRISEIKLAMSKSVEAETSVMRIIQRCYDAMIKAIEQVNPDKDTHVVVENFGSGYAPPEDDVFIDLGDPSSILQNGESAVDGMAATLKRGTFPVGNGRNTNGKAITRKQSMHLKLFGGGSSTPNQKVNTSNGEYGSLPPMQRCRKLEAKIKELDGEISKKEQARAGVQKMLEAYKSNPKMGNPSDVVPQIGEYSRDIVSLSEQREKFKRLLLKSKSELNTPIMSKSVEAETSVMRIIQRCYDAMNKAIEQVNPDKDTNVVVENFGSGYAPPEDDVFIDSERNTDRKAIPRKQSMHLKLFGGGSSTPNQKTNTSNGEDGSLPPMQRCRKLETKIKELDGEVSKKEQTRARVQKMLETYKSNPKIGNRSDVEPQIGEYSRDIISLSEQSEKFERLLLKSKSELNTSITSVGTMDSQTRIQFSAQNSPVSGSPRMSNQETIYKSRSGLMEAIRAAGGTRKMELKHVEQRKTVEKVFDSSAKNMNEDANDDLLSSLQKALVKRRQGISGHADKFNRLENKPKGSTLISVAPLSRLREVIPAPLPNSGTKTLSDDEDWG